MLKIHLLKNFLIMSLFLTLLSGCLSKVVSPPADVLQYNIPSISYVSPPTGHAQGGTRIAIIGLNFAKTATVTIADSSCTEVTVVSSTQITCLTPAGVDGYAALKVSNSISYFDSNIRSFYYDSNPSITSVSPDRGAESGGSTLTISGKNFLSGATVTIGAEDCTSPNLLSTTSITCTIPANAAGTYDIVVTNFDSNFGTLENGYTYQQAPTVTDISPNAGALAGGTTVTVIGTNFVSGATVKINGITCSSPYFVSSTEITCITPAGIAGSADITVTNSDSQFDTSSSAYNYQAAPTVTSLDKPSGFSSGNTTVVITGTGFRSGIIASFGSTNCATSVFSSPTQMTCVTAAHAAGLTNVTVTNSDQQVGSKVNAYTYIDPPSVTSTTPSYGHSSGSTAIQVKGNRFITGATVTVGGVVCTSPVVINSVTIACTTGGHAAGAVDVIVKNPDTQQGTGVEIFTYQAPPAISTITPDGGAIAGGSLISISGTGFYLGATVTIDGSYCTSPNVISSTAMTCVTPGHTAGAVNVIVTNTDMQASVPQGYTYQAAPTISSVDTTSGPAVGGTTINITGSGFFPDPSISIGGTVCTESIYVSDTSVTCKTPAHTSGLNNIIVTNYDNQSATLVDGFTFVAAPTVDSVSLSAGALAGGTTVTILGSGFNTGATVLFDVSACTSPNVISSSSMTCETPVHTAGIVNVVVTNPDSQVGTGPQKYTYQAAPTLTSLSQDSGALSGGTFITLSGSDFVTGATVTIGGEECTSPNVTSSSSMTCETVGHAAGPVDVIVTNADTQLSGPLTYTYQIAPTVSSIDTTSGPADGGTTIIITGSDFIDGATVSVGGTDCTLTTFSSDSSITCVTAAHPAGTSNLTVTNPDNQTGTLIDIFSFIAAPTITSSNPNAGTVDGATVITISGTGFIIGATVTIDGMTCDNPTVTSSTSITCETAAHVASAPVDIIVTNTDTLAQSGTGTGVYTYQVAPTVFSILPTAGPLTGGTAVTITGTGFLANATVAIGGVSCNNVIFVDPLTIKCTTGAHTAELVDVTVQNYDTQSATTAMIYTYRPSPTVTSILPSAGALAGGTAVSIIGTDFDDSATVITLGEANCESVTFINSTLMTCISTTNVSGTVDISVTNQYSQNGTLVGGYTYQAAPTIGSILPTAGALDGGTDVTIKGTGFLENATVEIGAVTCLSPTVVDSNTITCITTAHAEGATDVVVSNADTQTGTGLGIFTYQAAPTISGISPIAGQTSGGISSTITGTGFLTNATITIGGLVCSNPAVVSLTSMTCDTPAHVAGIVDIVVTNEDQQVGILVDGYTFQEAPLFSFILPTAGKISGGTEVTIIGNYFDSAASVTIGGVTCTDFIFNDSTSIACTTGDHTTAGTVDIVIMNSDGQEVTAIGAYSYQAAPSLTSLSPDSGALTGGTTITITGTGFVNGATVTIDGLACTSPNVIHSDSMTCITPAHTTGAVLVIVTNADTQFSGTLPYTYQVAPTILSIDTASGPAVGGTTITIDGSGFKPGVSVAIGDAACEGLTLTGSTAIECTTTEHPAGAYDIIVTNSDGQRDAEHSAFTYIAAPSVDSVSPNAGRTDGGSTITITGSGFDEGATVKVGGITCDSPTVENSTTLSCVTGDHSTASVVNIIVKNSDLQTGIGMSLYTYQDMAMLEWDTGTGSPNPPNPDNYGETSTNITHTFTLINNGNVASTTVTTSLSGSDQANWTFGTDNCNGSTLSAGVTCTVQVTFLGTMSASGSYSAIINATDGTTSATNSVFATKP